MSSSQTSSSNTEMIPGHEALPSSLAPMFDVRCLVEFVLGSGRITIRECLRLELHSIIRLQQSAGSDLTVRVHNVHVATGEVVIADETTALRINRVSPPAGVEVDSQ
jgi:flagellar motor switch/type III secretory pathway protein FliN